MKIIITAIALAVGCISTPASAWNIFDTLNVIRTINDTARTVAEVQAAQAQAQLMQQQAQQPVVVVLPPQVAPAGTVFGDVVAGACVGGQFNSYGNCVVSAAAPNTGGSWDGVERGTLTNAAAAAYCGDGHGGSYACPVATTAPAVVTEPAADCPASDNIAVDARVCIKTDKGSIVCGTYVGPQL
jgi:hypothetical protein